MKSRKIDYKRIIKRNIDIRNNVPTVNKNNVIIKNKSLENDNLSNLSVIKKNNKNVINERDMRRLGIVVNKPVEINNEQVYHKKVWVDYDVIICIPSHNRYDKVKRLLNQFYSQHSRYTFKIILLNDGSNDDRYDLLANEFFRLDYIKNVNANGKVLHWYCYNQLWNNLKNIESHCVLQMDDDFILCNEFLNIIMDMFFLAKEKNNRIMAIAPHLWSFNKKSNFESWWENHKFIDGIGLIDYDIIRNINYVLQPVNAKEVSCAGVPVRAWTQIAEAIYKKNGIVSRPNDSLVYHDGNSDSKLHGDVRINGKCGIYTQRFIENNNIM